MMPPESPCEGKGSFVRLLWDCRQGRILPSELGDRILLAQAGVRCCGGPRDEVIVQEVTNVMTYLAHHLDVFGFVLPLYVFSHDLCQATFALTICQH